MSYLFKIEIKKNNDKDRNHSNIGNTTKCKVTAELNKCSSSVSIKAGAIDMCDYWVIGDLIGPLPPSNRSLRTQWLQEARGNFIVLWQDAEGVQITGSMFQMDPVFYCIQDNEVWVSDKIFELIQKSSVETEWGKEYLLERLFFNYSLTNRTWFPHVHILPVNSYLNLCNDSISIIKHTELHNQFTDTPSSLKNTRDDLIDLFSETVKHYYPDEPFAVSFTGGFDGRCILASTLSDSQPVTAFSFGKNESDDVRLPKAISSNLGIPYHGIALDDTYVATQFRNEAESMVMESNGMSTVSRAHYRYATEWLKKNFRYFLSGNFGSELFRSVHLEGVMTSRIFYYWLQNGMPDNLKDFKRLFPEFSFIGSTTFDAAYLNLAENLTDLKQNFQGLPLSAMTYFILWEYTIQNYFSPELQMQKNHVIHRSPFLDYNFFKALQGTMFSGAYSKFREKNLMKRIKGQLFYAHYLKRTNKRLFREKTGKGYRPSDLITPLGLMKITTQKLLTSNKPGGSVDEFGVLEGLKKNAENWLQLVPDIEIGRKDREQIDIQSLATLASFGIYWRGLGLT